MTEKTYYIVQAFERKGRSLRPTAPTQYKSAEEAIGRAERDAKRFVGVVAIRQVADDESGEVVDEPVILARFGELPADMAGD